jgi:DNA-binding MarR family transcriptional regulator
VLAGLHRDHSKPRNPYSSLCDEIVILRYVAKSSSAARGHEASLIYVVGRVNQGIRREMRARLAEWELSVQEYTSLSVLGARPGLSNAQLARRALVTPQSMIEILSKLESRGLVARADDPDHGSIRRATLTAGGRDLLAAADPAILSIQEQLLADVPPRQREIVLQGMLSAMEKLSSRLDR